MDLLIEWSQGAPPLPKAYLVGNLKIIILLKWPNNHLFFDWCLSLSQRNWNHTHINAILMEWCHQPYKIFIFSIKLLSDFKVCKLDMVPFAGLSIKQDKKHYLFTTHAIPHSQLSLLQQKFNFHRIFSITSTNRCTAGSTISTPALCLNSLVTDTQTESYISLHGLLIQNR